MNKFRKFLLEQDEKFVSSELKLLPNTKFKPFIVDDQHRPNLRSIIKAFLNSNNVYLPGPKGYPSKLSVFDSNKGLIHPKLKKKNLYLTGGAVRDHIKNKTPRDYDLVTDATPDEIKLILSNAGFIEVKPKNSSNKKYDKLPEDKNQKKCFYVDKIDKSNNEYSFIIRVNDEEFEISTFRKNPKSTNINDKVFFSTLEDDSKTRDFTVNSMYILLNNPDGANTKLLDPNGGIHHIQNQDISFIGNAKDRLSEDQLRALRYIRFNAINDKSELPSDIIDLFKQNDLSKIEKKYIREEFLKGLENPDVDTKKYLKMYKDSGLLEKIFKNVKITNEPSDEKDKKLSIAWLLKDNPKENIEKSLEDIFDSKDINEIMYLIDINQWIIDQDKNKKVNNFFDLKQRLNSKINLVPSILYKWNNMNKINNKDLDKFLNYNMKIKKHIKDEDNNEILNPEIYKRLKDDDLSDEIIENIIKDLENKEFEKYFYSQI